MEKLKSITMEEAVRTVTDNNQAAYMLVRLYGDTEIEQLTCAEGFYVLEEATEEEVKAEVKTLTGKIIDHGRICALYTANPPRSVKWIADDMGITQQTVINHLKKEGIYKKEG